jgi:hypothetical protein
MEKVTRLPEMISDNVNANSEIDEFDRVAICRYAFSCMERGEF